jgi:Holliday junction resolvase RusA-like endonuclease
MNLDSFEWFLVEGVNPEPWVASLASGGRKAGKNYIQFYKPEQLRVYQDSLKDAFIRQNPHAVCNPGEIVLVFFFWRQRNEHEFFDDSKKSKSNIADATNLQKSTEDALQKLLYINDRQVIDVRSKIIEQHEDTVPKILIGRGEPDDEDKEAQWARQKAADLHQPEPEQLDNNRDIDVGSLF